MLKIIKKNYCMKKSIILWILAFLITILTAIYQRTTGPTYPIERKVELAKEVINVKLDRSHGGLSDHEVIINVKNSQINGIVYFKRYKTNDDWTSIPLSYNEGKLNAYLPYQPPAGKLEYFVELEYNNEVQKIPLNKTAIIRFKGDVPIYVLIPHIFAMFLGMMLSNRTGLEYLNNGKKIKILTLWTLGFLVVGGFILGPIMQKFAFGEYWTGFPFGHDLTDNKTLIAIVGWLIALYMYGKSKVPKKWALAASILLLLVYLIPHSVMGSELDYNKLDEEKSKIEILKE